MAQITLRDYLQETEDVIGNGHVDDALNRCQFVLARFPESLEAQRLLGEVYLAQGHFDEAQQTFDWVLTNDPENVIVYCDRALISERKADYDTALDCYQQAYELSRGNNKIRNEFNKLSEKVGQQGFMFSRAGLARLYMRGDLLTQAIQEWEAVLAVTPDRLDARTGLLEAYWRDGLYDRVEQLANQILQDVPGCAKALLLLAFVVSARDIDQARELLQRVEALDPDLIIAQDLFSDLIASQPNEPFLALLKRAPVDLEQEGLASTHTALSGRGEAYASSGSLMGAGSLSSWPSSESWNSENDLLKVSPETSVVSPSSDSPVWSNDSFAALSDVSNGVNQGQNGVAEAQSEQMQPDLSSYLNAMSSSGSSWGMPAPSTQQSSMQEEQQPEPWALLQGSFNGGKEPVAQDQSLLESTQWSSMEQLPEPSPSGFEWEQDEKELDTANFAGSWPSSSKGEDLSSAPDWLSMLTQGDRRQMSGYMPAIPRVESSAPAMESAPPVPQQPQAALPATAQPQAPQEPITKQSSPSPSVENRPEIPAVKEEEPVFAPFASGSTDEEDSFFGPAWLKALGAASMDDEESPQTVENKQPAESALPGSQEVQQQSPIVHDTWTAPAQTKEQSPETLQSQSAVQENQTVSEDPAWSSSLAPLPLSSIPSSEYSSNQPSVMEQPASYEIEQIQEGSDEMFSPALETVNTWEMQPVEAASQEPGPHDKTEQDLLVTLEELENNLRSNGFVPMEPNWLSALAQEQKTSSLSPEEPSLPTWAQGAYGEPPLSSALAELGNMMQPSSNPPSPAIDPTPLEGQPPLVQPAPATATWAATLRATPSPQVREVPPMLEEDFSDDGDAPTTHVAAVKRPAKPDASAAPPTPVVVPSPAPAKKPVEPVKKVEPVQKPAEPTPVARKDVFMDMELETTMKRPAIRLQPMQQRPAAPRGQSPQSPGGRSVERAATGKTADTNVNYQERLLKGYQHQLVGDYDEAMQEYRAVIRYAPALLSEVISNVRALLKLAPKYAAGYRVLGDAYMRQGEYLQAMEAYNKALTMAKKTKA